MAHILVAEDEADIMLLIRRKLESAGHEVIGVANGLDVLPLTLQEKPDLVLLDIMLPGREGIDVCRDIKTKLGPDAPPVLLMSARGQQFDVEAGFEAGADDYVIKPFSPRALLEHIEKLLPY
ncbi:MAG: response regulator transcription factor [Chloroflexi bacterium]|nr:response regulator transcription factor [Chloroflexota bacterium]